MKTILSEDLSSYNIDVSIFEVFAEQYVHRKGFSGYREHPRPCHALFFICSDAEATFYPGDAEPIEVKKGDVLFIPQGSRYWMKERKNVYEKINTYTVNFSLFDENHAPVTLSEQMLLFDGTQEQLLDVHFKSLFDAYNRIEENGKRNLIKSKAEFLKLLDMLSEISKQKQAFYYPIRKGVDAFCSEWNQNEKIEKYANLCGISVTYFYRCFRKWAGMSPIEYRNTLRLSNAERLLICTDMQISQISESIGFEDSFYFCRMFSRHYGLSPQKYRKNFQNRGI